jgi:hypothetical protein
MRIQSPLVLASLLLMMTSLTACSTRLKPPAVEPSSSSQPTPMEKMAMPQAAQSNEPAYAWQMTTPERDIQPSQSTLLRFVIQNQGTGLPVTTFNALHTKLAHLIIVSKDLKTFSHIHPDVLEKGQMQVKATFPRAGNYFMFIQFQPDKAPEQNLMRAIQIGNATLPEALLTPDAQTAKVVNGYTFRLSNYPTQINRPTMLSLAIEKNGQPITTIEPYLGAGGHTVLLSQDAQRFLHVHPMTKPVGPYYQSPLQFHTQIAQPGLYKLWTQVQLQGKVETVDFTFEVKL